MSESGARSDTLARLAESRAEIRRVLEPSPRLREGGEDLPGAHATDGTFPRSRTMKLLMSGRGVGTVSAVVGGLLLARPALAFRLLRMLPAGAVGRMLMVKAVTAFRDRRT